jgi:(p)ppGpp synthase/HD superfamily hydrolase
MRLVAEALDFATQAHEGQFRKGSAKIPYITHPVRVTQSLWDCGERSPIVLAAALLHDTIEDCGKTYAEIQQRFGTAVANLVLEVTDEPGLSGKARKEMQVLRAPTMSIGAKKIKMADKGDNLNDIVDHDPGWSDFSMRGYVASAIQVIEAMGNADQICAPLYDRFTAATQRVLVKVGQ